MTNVVSNPSADAAEKIERAAKILKASPQAKAIFELVYAGGKRFKTIEDMRAGLGNFNKRTYAAADRLASEDILEKKKLNGKNAFYKIPFYAHNRDHILRLAGNARRLKNYPTKRNSAPAKSGSTIVLRTRSQAQQIFVDDIESFKKVRKTKNGDSNLVREMQERKINDGITSILGQVGKNDWGGERNDIFSTRVRLKGKRIASSFALKGRGTKGTLTPKKMGKNGDQISRLFQGTSELHAIVYNGVVDESIFDMLHAQAVSKSIEKGKRIYYCVIDGSDLARLVSAYPENF